MTTTTLARTTDPASSKMAGSAVEKSKTASTQQTVLLRQFAKRSATPELACSMADIDQGWRRVSDLKKKKFIEARKDGQGNDLMWVNASGKRAVVYRITTLGRDFLRSLKANKA